MAVKLLHISDLHVTADNVFNTVVAQKISFIKANYPDHFYLITGDLIDNEGDIRPGATAPVGDILDAVKNLLVTPVPPFGSLEPHLQRTRLALQNAFALISQLSIDKVFLCPGNHDFGLVGNLYFQEFVDAFDRFIFRPTYTNRLVTQLGVLDNPLRLPSSGEKVPLLFTIPGEGFTVQLITLNTNPDQTVDGASTMLARGLVGGGQLAKLQSFLTADLMTPLPLRKTLGIVRFVALHHHPWTHVDLLKMLDADTLLPVLRNTTDLVLFGHRHAQKFYAPNSVEATGIASGGLASGWIRAERTAAEIVINSVNSIQINYVPIM